MIIVVSFSLSSSNPPCSILSHPKQRRNIPRATSQINSIESSAPVTRQTRRRCDCYDMYKEVVPFAEAWSWQKSIVEKRKRFIEPDEDISDTLIMLQHHPVYTLGTGSTENNLNFDIKDPPFPLYQTERGGEVTYHGPGQLVMYPIMNLRYQKLDLHWYMRSLEEVVIRVLSSTFSLKACRVEGLTGVWIGGQKLAAIGIRVSRWITFHGLALNVSTDLSPFDNIVPCGIRDRQVGSIKGLLGGSSDSHVDDYKLIDIAHDSLVKEFCEVFQVELCHQPASRLQFPEKSRQTLPSTFSNQLID